MCFPCVRTRRRARQLFPEAAATGASVRPNGLLLSELHVAQRAPFFSIFGSGGGGVDRKKVESKSEQECRISACNAENQFFLPLTGWLADECHQPQADRQTTGLEKGRGGRGGGGGRVEHAFNNNHYSQASQSFALALFQFIQMNLENFPAQIFASGQLASSLARSPAGQPGRRAGGGARA